MAKLMKLRFTCPNGLTNLVKIENVETGEILSVMSAEVTMVPNDLVRIQLVLDPMQVEIDLVGYADEDLPPLH